MAINASVPGTSKVSPFDFGDMIRVRYKTDGRKIEGDFKAYKKTATGWELVWVEEDFNYEWYCWVEWSGYSLGEWKVEFIDRVAGTTEEVLFAVGNIIECYRGVNIFKHFSDYPPAVETEGVTGEGSGQSYRNIEVCKKAIDDAVSRGKTFDQCIGPETHDCTEIGKQEILETCPDGTDKRWKTCLPFGYGSKLVVEVYRGAVIYRQASRYYFEYFNTIGQKVTHSSSSLSGAKSNIDANISAGCTFYIIGEWIEDEQTCPVTCTEGETRNEAYCPDGVTKKSWEECVSGKWKAKTQTCPETCTEGEKRNVVLCPDGEYMRSWEECVSGEWVSKTGICGCAAGTTSCQGYDLYTCIDGEWVLKEKNSVECGYTENGKVSILDPIISWIETSFDVDRKTAEMYAYLGIAGIGAVVILGVMSK